jgi:NADP-dependent 3-hydroxy acid dehydrogenase YdfG|tara:strand:- start:1029 stop:1259 length:231 start_codon:yes stop_codon:yes gene_type:complete
MEKMTNRIQSLVKGYESKVLEADENIKLLLNNAGIIPEHTDINKDIDKWLEVKSSNFGKLQHIASYLPKKENKDGK